MKQLPHDFANEALKGTPPVAVAATSMVGAVDWETWVFIATFVYVLMQIVWLLWKFADRIFFKKTDDD